MGTLNASGYAVKQGCDMILGGLPSNEFLPQVRFRAAGTRYLKGPYRPAEHGGARGGCRVAGCTNWVRAGYEPGCELGASWVQAACEMCTNYIAPTGLLATAQLGVRTGCGYELSTICVRASAQLAYELWRTWMGKPTAMRCHVNAMDMCPWDRNRG